MYSFNSIFDTNLIIKTLDFPCILFWCRYCYHCKTVLKYSGSSPSVILFFLSWEFHTKWKNLKYGAYFIWAKFFLLFLGKFGQKNQNSLLKMSVGTYSNSNMLSSTETFICFAWTTNPFLGKFGLKNRIACLSYNLIPGLT